MDIFKIVGVGLITCVVAVLIKQIKPEYYVVVVLAGGIAMLLMVIDGLEILFNYFSDLIGKTDLSYQTFAGVLKILGVGFLTEFASGICVDSGNASVGDKIILAGKVIILCLVLPIITTLLDTIVAFLP